MNNIKYIMIDNIFPVLFGAAIPHERFKNHNITSAGFAKLYINEKGHIDVVAHGHSEGLGIKSKPIDSETIRTIFNLNREGK